MRDTKDRIRHVVSFEVIALAIVIPAASAVFGMSMGDSGVVTVVSAVVATSWNYVYNLLFDRAMLHLRGSVHKTVPMRIGHTLLFEAGLMIVLLPFFAWYLGISVMQAFVMDVSFSAFFMAYAFFFNWAYDVIFPIPAHPAPVGGAPVEDPAE